MDNVVLILISILQITLLDITLSGDNVSVIALAIRNLPEKQAKLASLIGVGGAVGLRILFTCIISLIMSVEWLPIKLIGGLLLIKITWNLLHMEEVEEDKELNASDNLWRAVISIIIADLSMGLDNVLAIAGAANGNIGLIIFGLSLSIPIIFFGAKYVANLMNKYEIIVYIGAGLLIYTAINMITSDNLISKYVSDLTSELAAIIVGIAVVVYGVIKIRREKLKMKNISSKDIFDNRKDYIGENSKKI
jgi:YjbE family integral membrane protein